MPARGGGPDPKGFRMIPELTPAVARAVAAAQARALAAGAAEVGPLHLLQGLLEEEEGRVAVLLAGAGLTAAESARLRADRPAAETPDASAVPLGDQARQAFRRARQLARELSGERTIASEALLLALLHVDLELRAFLEPLGLRADDLEAEVLRSREPPLRLEEPLEVFDPTERVDAARVLDAAANRAREGLRVVEDYCRFVLDDALLTGETKRLRHDVTAALAEVAPGLLLAARETERDVGTGLSTAAEQERSSLADVVRANLKRLQEAFRTLEEFGKFYDERLGQTLGQLRYRGYTLERVILLGAEARQRLEEVRLCVLLSGDQCVCGLETTVREAAAGGAGMIQLREKGLPDRELLGRARQVRHWTRETGVLFIVNDRPDIARLAEADGVHLGQDDLPVREARRILGPEALIGVSTHDGGQLRQAVLDGASYVGVGPVFPSGTKDFAQLAGLDFVRQAAETALPAFAIGGVNRETLPDAVAAGARRVAVSQAIAASEDPRASTTELFRILQGG